MTGETVQFPFLTPCTPLYLTCIFLSLESCPDVRGQHEKHQEPTKEQKETHFNLPLP